MYPNQVENMNLAILDCRFHNGGVTVPVTLQHGYRHATGLRLVRRDARDARVGVLRTSL
jgi:hypothetical protein